jgi:hypothetical protein
MLHHPPNTDPAEINSAVSMDFRDRFNAEGMPPDDPPYTVPEVFITHRTTSDDVDLVTRHVPKFDFSVQTMDELAEYMHSIGYFAREGLDRLMECATLVTDGKKSSLEDLSGLSDDEIVRYMEEGVRPGDVEGDHMVCVQTMTQYSRVETTYMPVVERRGIAYLDKPTKGGGDVSSAMKAFLEQFWDGHAEATARRN